MKQNRIEIIRAIALRRRPTSKPMATYSGLAYETLVRAKQDRQDLLIYARQIANRQTIKEV